MTHLPLETKPRWYTTELASTLFAALPTFITAVGGIIKGAHDKTPGYIELGVGVMIALVVGTTFKAVQSRQKDAKDAAKQSHKDLEGCLYILHAAILAMRHLAYEDRTVAKLRV